MNLNFPFRFELNFNFFLLHLIEIVIIQRKIFFYEAEADPEAFTKKHNG